MKLNKKLEIGMSVITLLKGKTTPVRVVDMAPLVGTTTHFLEQIMRDLRNAGLVTVKRGPGGGYTVANTGTEVTALVVASAVGYLSFSTDLSGVTSTERLKQAITQAFQTTLV